TVDPSGRAPAAEPTPAPAAPAKPTAPVIITIGPDGKPVEAPDAGDDTGYYHSDDVDGLFGYDEPVEIHQGPVPELHVVRRGDTLWDICWFYFNDPWQWPKIWSYNPSISNPHWIYPGDLVRLIPRGMIAGPTQPLPDDVEGGGDAGGDFEPAPAKKLQVSLRQVAFVDQEELDRSIRIDGAVDEKELLAEGDSVYLSYPEDKPPKVGERYSIYVPGDEVDHPRSGKQVGNYVRILGELQVTSVKQGKRARALITDSNREIERGALVGPLVKQMRTVPPARNQVDAQGTIIAMLTNDQLVGSGEVVFIDLGEKSGLEVGNRMYVVRRGDAYEDVMGPSSMIGQDDRRFPARALGEVVIVDVGKNVSIGLITLSVQEMGIGDLVMMQKTE
ncbi:MAG: LysM peptidoglycan-binding domain-containing protein, partial [Myxococcales bacterium]|nr:LysM peptidoglycan-binding domain-containing protein [Myxococcales bacterium]